MRIFLTPVALIGFQLLVNVRAANSADSRLTLWYDRLAQYWGEALPVGNGRIGAMVYGGLQRDHIQLNEEICYAHRPRG
jgi:alpha-L-fucosidase 2